VFNLPRAAATRKGPIRPVGRGRAADSYATTRSGFGEPCSRTFVVDEQTRVLDLDDDRYTENTTAPAYPISFIGERPSRRARGGHPQNVGDGSTADAFPAWLPPISTLRLTDREGAMYQLSLSGLHGQGRAATETGVNQPTGDVSSTCFRRAIFCRLRAEPLMAAEWLGEKDSRRHHGPVSGWSTPGWDRRSVRRRHGV